MSIIIEFDKVTQSTPRKLIINQVSFKIKKGELTTIIGPNGAGKTTIAKLILGLSKPSSGYIKIAQNSTIAYAPQKIFFSQDLPITVKYFINLLGTSSKKLDNDITEKLLDFAEFTQLQSMDISQLSGGQLQKIILAATLLNNADLLILDEPVQFLDIQSQQEFYSILSYIRRRLSPTIVMISHDLYTVMKNSDQVICLNGHICCSGCPSDLVQDQDFVSSLSNIGFYTHHHDHRH